MVIIVLVFFIPFPFDNLTFNEWMNTRSMYFLLYLSLSLYVFSNWKHAELKLNCLYLKLNWEQSTESSAKSSNLSNVYRCAWFTIARSGTRSGMALLVGCSTCKCSADNVMRISNNLEIIITANWMRKKFQNWWNFNKLLSQAAAVSPLQVSLFEMRTSSKSFVSHHFSVLLKVWYWAQCNKDSYKANIISFSFGAIESVQWMTVMQLIEKHGGHGITWCAPNTVNILSHAPDKISVLVEFLP